MEWLDKTVTAKLGIDEFQYCFYLHLYICMGANTKISSINWISTRKTYWEGYNVIKYIKYILVSHYMKLSTNKYPGLAWLNTLVNYYAYNTLGIYYAYNTLDKYWLKFYKLVTAFQNNKVDVMANICKKGILISYLGLK